ncbi:M24 family metallopeptidase [Lutispora sp.]|uniref:M24 family metallopeptidase n=1 Tax=Lutispora sp. TaxID=2828727 RepID=UPI000ED19021|nr:Xaa-Pro peptidase family protein [Lutispora sp.]MEA4961648.1 Xaa-Pro peptidase family protein [Lutispora sp.]HCJ58794.1 aminopeptidase P family protein [Clostridiaceae bacterium]
MDIRNFVSQRIERLKNKLAEKGLDTAIIMKPENAFYFSNFNPVINSHPCFVIISVKKGVFLLVHSIRCDHAKVEGALENVQLYGKWGANKSLAMDPIDAVREILSDEPIRLGLELDAISFKLYQQILKKLNIDAVEDISNEINMMKIIKDEYEISCIRKSADLVDIGVEATIKYLQKGYSEACASTEGQYQMRKAWSEKYGDTEVCGFGTSEGGMIDSLHVWCLSNEHIAYGCDCPKHYIPIQGDISLPMAWAKVNGYHAENERTVIINKIEGKKDKAYKSMLEARQAIFDIMRPGVTFESLYLAAADVFIKDGFGDILPGRVGHGVGNSAHEFPSLAKENLILLEAGMVITVEPGLMEKTWGGARHSDTVLITDNGYECLTKLNNGSITINK